MTEPAFQTRTNHEGFFVFSSLQPESYRIRIEKQGFAAYEPSNVVTLAPGTETPLNDIVLNLGVQATGATVVEPHVAVQTSNAEVSANLTTAQLDTLPILDRNPLALVLTQAGVVSASGAFTTIDGLRTSLSNVTLDGINIQDNTVRNNGLDFVVNNLVLSQTSQFTLVTSNQAVTYGNGITQTAFVTPSGTNELHGSAFYLNSNNTMNANSWLQNAGLLGFAPANDAYKSNQGGFTIGGPLIKNKLFGYAAYEFLRQRNSIGSSALALPAGYAQQVAAADGVTINPVIAGLLSQIPSPNTNISTFAPYGVFEHAESQQADYDNAIARLDYTPSKRSAFAASYLWNRTNVDGGLSLYGSRAAEAQHERATLISGSWRFMATPHFTNELRAGADLSPVAFINREATTPYSFDLGFYQFLNPVDAAQPQGRTLKTYDVQDNASYLLGRHDIQFGFQAQLIRVASYLQNNSLPTIFLGLDGTGSSADTDALLSGSFYEISQQFFPINSSGAFGAAPDRNYLSLDNYAIYVQDKWKVNRRLVLTAGLRYEHYSTFRDSQGLFYTPQLANGNLAATFTAPVLTYSPQGSGFYPSMNNVGPSIGMAFDPTGSGRTVLRAAYGIGYVNDDFVEAMRSTLTRNELYLGSSATFDGTLSAGILQGLSSLVPVPPGGSGVSSTTNAFFPRMGLIDPRLRAPYVQQWSAGIQREMKGFVLDLRYVGNHAVRLLRQDKFFPENNAAGFLCSPNCINSVYYTSNSSASTYNALQFDVSRRLRRDVQFQANYTFGKALTDSNTFTSRFVDPYRDPDNHSLDKGPAVFDVRHAFKINLTYDLPFGRGRLSSMPLRAVFGGWSISAIAVAQSGEPFSILYGDCQPSNPSGSFGLGCQTANTLIGGSDLSQIVSFHMTGNGPSIINTDAPGQVFLTPAPGSPGSLGLRSFNGPRTFNLDLGLQKQFRITERQSLELRGIAINAFNHPSFGFNNQDISSSTFGQSAYVVYPPRTVQLSAYYRF